MEKYRFYVDLPGDFWESGVMMRYLRSKEIKVQARGVWSLPACLPGVCLLLDCGHVLLWACAALVLVLGMGCACVLHVCARVHVYLCVQQFGTWLVVHMHLCRQNSLAHPSSVRSCMYLCECMPRLPLVQVEWDAATGQYVLPHKAFTKVFQVRTELQLLDPSER